MEKSNKHTLIIDGNYFLFRTLHVLPKTKGKILLQDKEDADSFMLKLSTDFSYQVRLFDGLINKIVWTVDSRSWRKDFYPEADYKGNRTQDTSINWSNFSKVSDDFIKIISGKGVIISKTDGAEGDDLIYAWDSVLKSHNKPVIIFTGDRDLVQLVNKSSNNLYTILFSPAHKKLYTHQGFSEWINSTDVIKSNDIFDIMKISTSPQNQTKKLLQELIKKKKISVIEIDPEEFRFSKVLTGDSGDNVLSAYYYVLNGRRYGISEKKASLIVSEFKQKHGTLSYMYLFNDEMITDLANILIKNVNAKHMSREQIISNLRSNVNLMVLCNESIPSGILDDMYKSIENKININSLNFKEISSTKSLLEGTSYKIKESGISISSKIFKDSDDSSDFSFITDRKSNKPIF
jgi:5'-3' exonuclease